MRGNQKAISFRLFLLGAALFLLSQPAFCQERWYGPSLKVDLVTVGPGDDLFALWGHSSLCVHAGKLEDGTCFDFGITPERDMVQLALGTLKGEPKFVPIAIPTKRLLDHYAFREVSRQPLRLDPEQSRRLIIALRKELRQPYVYQPVFNNCSSRLRDLIDDATGGALRKSVPQDPGSPTLRTLAEEGLSGQVLPLFLTELAGGSTLDGPSSLWQRMAFPKTLSLGIAQQLRSPAALLHPAAVPQLPTSRHAGRIVLLLMAFLLAVAGLSKKKGLVRTSALLGPLYLALLGVVPVLGSFSRLPSLHENWALGVVCIGDAVLLLQRKLPQIRFYLLARLGVLACLALACLTGLIAQPLLPLIVAVGSLLLMQLRLSRRERLLSNRPDSAQRKPTLGPPNSTEHQPAPSS